MPFDAATEPQDEHEAEYRYYWHEIERMQLEINKPRCGSCDRFDLVKGTCNLHGEVPKEYRWQPSECGEWVRIPF
jgi:hypothetical protein